ncbi:MAG TPA: hypothetical protein VK815_11310 [Candidatus Acidoferrales bacterium]|jgi:hypothetical protein|nr:hypothetical protein [Candidatus Acidoferrales bacterium]
MSSISSVTPATNPYQITTQNTFAQSVNDFKAIGSALQSGDLSSAQSALAAFQQNQPAAAQSANSQPFGKNNQANTDYQTLTTALQSGDLAGAQKAFSSIQSDLKSAQAAHKGHGHHHHHEASSATTATTAATSSTSTTPGSATTGGVSNGLNAVA